MKQFWLVTVDVRGATLAHDPKARGDEFDPSTFVTDMHPADWIAQNTEAPRYKDHEIRLICALPISEEQFKKLQESY